MIAAIYQPERVEEDVPRQTDGTDSDGYDTTGVAAVGWTDNDGIDSDGLYTTGAAAGDDTPTAMMTAGTTATATS